MIINESCNVFDKPIPLARSIHGSRSEPLRPTLERPHLTNPTTSPFPRSPNLRNLHGLTVEAKTPILLRPGPDPVHLAASRPLIRQFSVRIRVDPFRGQPAFGDAAQPHPPLHAQRRADYAGEEAGPQGPAREVLEGGV